MDQRTTGRKAPPVPKDAGQSRASVNPGSHPMGSAAGGGVHSGGLLRRGAHLTVQRWAACGVALRADRLHHQGEHVVAVVVAACGLAAVHAGSARCRRQITALDGRIDASDGASLFLVSLPCAFVAEQSRCVGTVHWARAADTNARRHSSPLLCDFTGIGSPIEPLRAQQAQLPLTRLRHFFAPLGYGAWCDPEEVRQRLGITRLFDSLLCLHDEVL